MRKFIAVFLSVLFLCFSSVSVFANETNDLVKTNDATKTANIPIPKSTEQKNIDGTNYIYKVFEVESGYDVKQLIEKDFEQDKILYSYYNTEEFLHENKDIKHHDEPQSYETKSKDLQSVLKEIPQTVELDRDGYKGTLSLDATTVETSVRSYKTVTSSVSDTREYFGLMYQDPSYVESYVTKNGYTLPLLGVDWQVTGTGLSGDSLVATEYKAVARYGKQVSSQVPTSYTTKAIYRGEVEKDTISTVEYKIAYKGTPIFEEVVPKTNVLSNIIIPILITLLLIGLLVLLFLFLKKRMNESNSIEIYNLIDGNYVCLGKQQVDLQKPILDLNVFSDEIQSNDFAFILDKNSCKKLFGKTIAVTLEDITVMHMVKEYNQTYKFNLELGGFLDAK